ncbi:MAG: rhodanese-like domain-containing protein [Solirubrobacteraceae bacterium]
MSTFADPEHELPPRRVAELVTDEGWQVIDVREPYEREAGRIPGTRHIELERLASQAQTIERDRPVVFYCRLGARSGMAAQAFRTAGYEAYNMTGGLMAWHDAGLALEPEGGHVAEH